ncbi:MAG: hypothetical protein IPP10_12960 [Candidatus Competibacteraceae bacterium]|nr:hypothetical protein [Candidatus Competibacteraceae bacterium]MBK9952395.1 hypothetical protein [Candidatus Competibacteraceae bacterium]
MPDALHVEQIATLEYPDNQALALAYANVLLNACSNNGLLSTKAQYQDWWIENGATDEVSEEFQWWYKNLFEYVSEKGSTPLVTRTAYRDWLIQKGQSLRTWWFPADVTDSFLPVSKDTLFPDIMNQSLSQLSLAERAKGGLLTSEPELWLNEILELEFPSLTTYEDRQRPERINWKKSVEVAIQYGMLSGCHLKTTVQSETHHYLDNRRAYFNSPREKAIHIVGCSDWRIPREPYRTWRATQLHPPVGSIIHLWLGATLVPPTSKPIEMKLSNSEFNKDKRQISLAEVEDTALARLREQLGREPDFEEFWLHIIKHDDTGTIADYTDDLLMWTGKDGRQCQTKKTTLRNRLTAAKKRNPFKP